MKMSNLVPTLIALGLLAGCGQPSKDLAMPPSGQLTLVFSPGYEVAMAGKPVNVFGFDACPTQDPVMTRLFGPAPDDGATSCIVVTPETKSVRIRYRTGAHVVTEEWSVGRDSAHPDRTYLNWSDGSPVISYAEFKKIAVLEKHAPGTTALAPNTHWTDFDKSLRLTIPA